MLLCGKRNRSYLRKPKSSDKTFEEQINGADKEIKVLYQNLSNYILSLGDDISETHLSLFYQ